jgi:DNA polymerase-1
MYDIELPLCRVLADMERAAFSVDRKALYDYGEGMTGAIDALQKDIWKPPGTEFNINSPKQLGEVLFERAAAAPREKDQDRLEHQRRRAGKAPGQAPWWTYWITGSTAKLKSTYADGLLKVMDPDGRIHTSFQMTVTATGRLSSTEPNLQNIPTRTELGSEIRKMFVAAEGNVLVDADYSQIELRLLAHISGDEAMREAFRPGMDFHTATAAQVFNVPPEDVTHDMRRRAKAVNFGIVYGISAFSLARTSASPPRRPRSIWRRISRNTGVRQYMKRRGGAGQGGRLCGDAVRPPAGSAGAVLLQFQPRSFGERVALNMPIQGTAADMMKLAMVNVAAGSKRRALRQSSSCRCTTSLSSSARGRGREVKKLLTDEEMENVVHLSVPLTAEAKSGRTWAEAH